MSSVTRDGLPNTSDPTPWSRPDGCADFDKARTSCWVKQRSSKRAWRDCTRAQTTKKHAGTLGHVQGLATYTPLVCRGGSYDGGAEGRASTLPPITPRRQATGPWSLIRDCLGQPMQESARSPPISHCFDQNLLETFSKAHRHSPGHKWIPKDEQWTLVHQRLTKTPWGTLHLRLGHDAVAVNRTSKGLLSSPDSSAGKSPCEKILPKGQGHRQRRSPHRRGKHVWRPIPKTPRHPVCVTLPHRDTGLKLSSAELPTCQQSPGLGVIATSASWLENPRAYNPRREEQAPKLQEDRGCQLLGMNDPTSW